MPKRTDIKSILIPGSGPIVIGQAVEFDYSGNQACKVLKKEGFRTILLNSNPATIMTDPDVADVTYIEPMTPEVLLKIIDKEKPDAILPTVGGQTALNLVMDLWRRGEIQKRGIKLIGANAEAIEKAESREKFKEAIKRIGLKVPESELCESLEQAIEFKNRLGLPLIIRPSFTLGGTGGGIAFTDEEFIEICKDGLNESPTHQILVEQSILGWKEYELEVMRDSKDNVVIICSIENLDPMGVHTGDSITIAPQQTLSDVQYQKMRDAAIAIIREIGVETGGSNIQFAVNPKNGDMVVIEMNPRVSRSSALASKATGFPIAKIAALLAVGYTLDEIPNDITKVTPASFEPTIDYVVTKMPRFAFEKFPGTPRVLGSMMKSVGETMAIGRTFLESFQKACRSLEIGRFGYGSDGNLEELFKIHEHREKGTIESFLVENLHKPNPDRIFLIKVAMELHHSGELSFPVERIYELSKIDPWFLYQFEEMVQNEQELHEYLKTSNFTPEILKKFKEQGYSDRQLAYIKHKTRIDQIIQDPNKTKPQKSREILQIIKQEEEKIRALRNEYQIKPIYHRVDTCGGEFEAKTPYLYSSYEELNEIEAPSNQKILIIGGGPNRIGQGVEFDYCCCHASFALKEMNITSIMVNSNPETVSTDYDTSDVLFFEPLTEEDILHICEVMKPDGIIVQFGGQTPLKLAQPLQKAGYKILGTSPESIHKAEDRKEFSLILQKLHLNQPPNGIAYDFDEALKVANQIGYPCLVRPSYVLGGRAMAIVYDDEQLRSYMEEAVLVNPEHPILIDKFLDNAIELDVDALSDGETVFVAGILEHIEEAGVHSGDSACIIPPISLSPIMIEEIKRATELLAKELNVIGLINVQYAIQNQTLYVLEVNPRASRTVPFVSKAIGIPLAKIATKVMLGGKLKELLKDYKIQNEFYAAKEVVLPFSRFSNTDIILGPEMKSTGEVMGIARRYEEAYLKAIMAAGEKIPPFNSGVFISVSDEAKRHLIDEIKVLHELGYVLYATEGTKRLIEKLNIPVIGVYKLIDKKYPTALDFIEQNKIKLVINIPHSKQTRDDSFEIRRKAIRSKILCITTLNGSKTFIRGLKKINEMEFDVYSLQEIHRIRHS
ncbi:MAG: carbamoyl-phosphate synthase large subunit [Leptospiraceae bacterium]|nr:carbamoyl-phosphate synthase large subunit [Leptospiraceae bacterium]MDW7976506.1 carbamoyl-phosphate synthase large subunit [Leptospiraceae bacterium]